MQYETDTNLAVHVPDLAKAKEFYIGVLGFRLLEETIERLVLATGSRTLFVVWDEVMMPFIPALRVHDLDEARRHLEAHDGKIVRGFAPTRSFYFEDPFGIVWDVNNLESSREHLETD
ncbi:MAG TPA: VOC family protein [Anaerolineales bacterium]|nr:VOC family protein [Anaerolineales bacterium]